MHDLTFRALAAGFSGQWPARLPVENRDYAGTLFHTGQPISGTPPDRRDLTLTCKPRDPEQAFTLRLVHGRVVLSQTIPWADMGPDEARQLSQYLDAAIASAEALEGFLTDRFGPID